MTCQKLSYLEEIKKLLSNIGSTHDGVSIMNKKADMQFFLIKRLKTPAANILKQEALSLGADFAVPKDAIIYKDEFVNGVLIITKNRLEFLVKKISIQDFGLKELSSLLKQHLNIKKFKLKIMGILNANEDSFYENSRFDEKNAITKIQNMIDDGVDIIDIGAVSSRPGSIGISPKEELQRLKPIITQIYKHKLFEKMIFSLDSYSPLCLEFAFDHGFKIANDITALNNDEVAKICAKYDATVCLMHMQNDPKTMQENPTYEDVVCEVDEFFKTKIQKAKRFGITNLILDAGIGFGKNLEHNLKLIKASSHFTHHGYEILVGASRKSLINLISKSEVQNRLAGTLALHLKALDYGANIIRCHDTYEHVQALRVYEKLKQIES